MNTPDLKTFTITLPKVGVGLQGSTLALIVWLGGQANMFVDELTTGFTDLVERVTALEGTVKGMGVDVEARGTASAAETRNTEQDAIITDLVTRIEKVERCGGKKKCT